jgi:hypothetical protein
MKITLQFGEKKFEFEDGEGSGVILEQAVDEISDLLKSVFPLEMEGQRLIVVDQEFADHLMDTDMVEGDEIEERLCDEHKHLAKDDEGKRKLGHQEN